MWISLFVVFVYCFASEAKTSRCNKAKAIKNHVKRFWWETDEWMFYFLMRPLVHSR